MTKMTLYTGGGVSYSPEYAEGRTESVFVRLVADDGMGITDGIVMTTVVDTNDPDRWTDCDAPVDPDPEEEATSADYESALTELGVAV